MNLFDTDLYKFTESQFAWWYYPNVKVVLTMTSRSGVDVFSRVDPEELQQVLDEPIQRDELYMRRLQETPGFFKDYVQALREATFPRVQVTRDRHHAIRVSGPWWTTALWETHIMSAVSELYYRGTDLRAARDRLTMKRNVLSLLPKRLSISDFGTRRRHSREWHSYVVQALHRDGLLAGTSNFVLAIEAGLPCVGTMPHAIFMVPAALVDNSPIALRAVPQVVMEQWRRLYGNHYNIALTDTFGTRSFLQDMTDYQARAWGGLRQDSGDPLAFAAHASEFYHRHGVTQRKRLIFSDRLTVPKMLTIDHNWGEQFDCSYGWGTDETNDTGDPALDIIVKPITADSRATVKLSDTTDKGLSIDKASLVEYMRVFA